MRHAALAALLAALVAAVPAAGDRVHLTNGRVIEGIVLSQSASQVVVEIGAGEMTLPASLVARVETAASVLDGYRAQASTLAAGDASGWLALARWAAEQGLETKAIEAYERVIAADPDNAVAQQALGRVRHEGHWLRPEERARAMGYVEVDGRWVPPAVALAAEELRLRRLESQLRLREAEARARAAEAEERRLGRQVTESDAVAAGLLVPSAAGPLYVPWWGWAGGPRGEHPDGGARASTHDPGAPAGAAGGAGSNRRVTGPSAPATPPAPGRDNRASVPRP